MSESHPLVKLWVDSEDSVKRRHAQFLLEQKAKLNGTKAYPSAIKQMKNAAVAAGKAITSGFAGVDKEEQNRRLEICNECEFFDHKQGRCTKCGCFGVFKTWLATQKCPVGKW